MRLCLEDQELELVTSHVHLLSACFMIVECSVVFMAAQSELTAKKCMVLLLLPYMHVCMCVHVQWILLIITLSLYVYSVV